MTKPAPVVEVDPKTQGHIGPGRAGEQGAGGGWQPDGFDVLVLVGAILLAYGLWRWSPTLAFIVIGAVMLAAGALGAVSKAGAVARAEKLRQSQSQGGDE